MSDDVAPKRERVRTPVGEVSRTKQSFRDECDVNLIVKNHGRNGVVSHFNGAEPSFGDYTEAVDLKAAMDRVFEANETFASLPSAVRRVAGESPVEMLAMLQDPDGANDLVDAGLDLELPPEWRRETPENPASEGAPEVPTPSGVVDPE